MTVLEHLDGPKERRIAATAAEWREERCADLNILALDCVAGPDARPLSRRAGLPDDAFRHDGQITKRAVRAATLAALAPLPGELLWDIGAGSGSIGIEWLRADERMRAIAIERDPARAAVIAENAAMLGVAELKIIQGAAPDALHGLAAPDAIFIGGGVGDAAIWDACWPALKPGGRLVANAVTVKAEAEMLRRYAAWGGELQRIAVAQAEGERFWRPAMTVTQLSLRKRMIERALLGWRPYALLTLLCLGLYLPGLVSLPVTDRDEARFVQASRQMLETHDLIAIRFQDEARNKKPAGIYWLQAASTALFSDAASDAIWPYRVPSLLGASAAALMTFGMGARLVGRKAAFVGAALLAASLGLGIEAHLAKTDAVLLACIAAAQLALARIYLDAKAGLRAPLAIALLFWAALACGILVKGPVAPLVAALTVIALTISERRARWLRDLRPVGGHRPAGADRAALADRDFDRDGGTVPQRLARPRFPRQADRRAREPWRAAALLPRAADGQLLARHALPRPGDRLGLAAAPRRCRALPDLLGRAVLDRAGAGPDQAAELSAAGLSGARAHGRRGAGRGRRAAASRRGARSTASASRSGRWRVSALPWRSGFCRSATDRGLSAPAWWRRSS